MRASATALVLVLGCSCGARQGSAGPSGSSGTGSTTPPSRSAHASAMDYEVHEWGLVRAEAGDVLRAGAVAPPVSVVPLVVLKPVLYFHTTTPLTLGSVVVRASEGGSLAEVWPLAPFDTTVRWENVALDPSGACEASALPTVTEPPCATLPAGDLCEAAGLAVARTTDAACVRVGTSAERFLFYRARVTRFTPPLSFQRTSTPDEVRITNEGALPIPGLVVRLRSSMGVVQALAVVPPAPGTASSVSASFEDGVPTTTLALRSPRTAATVGIDTLRRSMLEIGLSEPEADAFLAAWNDALFGTTAASLDAPPPVDSFVYFLPEASTDGIATLALDPPPRAIHRAIAVWSVLRADGGLSH